MLALATLRLARKSHATSVRGRSNSVYFQNSFSILLCTHDMGEAEELCNRVGIMMDGKILALEESEELKRRYATNGRVPTREETFMAATGYSIKEASAEGDQDA